MLKMIHPSLGQIPNFYLKSVSGASHTPPPMDETEPVNNTQSWLNVEILRAFVLQQFLPNLNLLPNICKAPLCLDFGIIAATHLGAQFCRHNLHNLPTFSEISCCAWPRPYFNKPGDHLLPVESYPTPARLLMDRKNSLWGNKKTWQVCLKFQGITDNGHPVDDYNAQPDYLCHYWYKI